MNSEDGLIFAYRLDGRGGGQGVGWSEIRKASRDDLLWIHLNYRGSETRRWLTKESGIDPLICEALLATETRPRVVGAGDGLLVVLRGVNLNPGADPEDMVSLRMWIDGHRIVTMRYQHLKAIEDLRAAIASASGPTGTGHFLVEIANRLVERMGDVLANLDDTVDSMEDEVLTAESYEIRPKLASLRRQAIGLRRYLAPQREVLSRLQTERSSWLSEMDRVRLREVADRTTRYVEDLDSARDRAAVTQEELNSRLSEQMNRRVYVLAVVAGIFLPLGLLTGLLGINVGGIPGTENKWAFAIVCVLLLGLAATVVWVFRRKKWM